MRRLWLLALLPAVVAAASAALACTPQARSFAVSPKAAVAGARASVVGQGVTPGGPVEVRWNHLDGGVIATAVADGSGRFRADVVIPAAAPGVYSVLFKAGEGSTTAGVGRLPFEVTGLQGRSSTRSDPGAWTDARPATGEPGLAVGAGLAGIGAITLAGGSAVAALRRSRRRAS